MQDRGPVAFCCLLLPSFPGRWKEYTEDLYKKKNNNHKKKDLSEPDNYNGVVCHPEADILESEVKWALGETLLSLKLVDRMKFQ